MPVQYLRKISSCILLSLLTLSCELSSYSYFQKRHHEKKEIDYNLIDIGPTYLPCELLSKQHLPVTFAAAINNSGQVIYNDSLGGALWEPQQGVRRLFIGKTHAHFHAINNQGVILASLANPNSTRQWFLWPQKCGLRLDPIALPSCFDSQGYLYLRALNDECGVAGFIMQPDAHPDSAKAFMLNKTSKVLGPGLALALSERGYALVSNKSNNTTLLWHERGGVISFDDDICTKIKSQAQGNSISADVLTRHGAVYGSFSDAVTGRKRAYRWEPLNSSLTLLELQGMQINAANASEDLVGKIGQQAVFSDHTSHAICNLNKSFDAQSGCWQLIEATDINDLGQIVGYGLFNGKTHIFLLEPTPHVTKVYYNKPL